MFSVIFIINILYVLHLRVHLEINFLRRKYILYIYRDKNIKSYLYSDNVATK